jgi:S1-C subfamily serine protease
MTVVPVILQHRLRSVIIAGLLVWLAVAAVLLQHRTNTTSAAPPHPSGLPPTLGVVVDGNLQVVAVDAMGSAARAGIQPGDVIRKIAGVALPATVSIDPRSAELPSAVPASVRTSDQVKAAFLAAVPDGEHPVTIVLERNGKTFALHVLVTTQAFNYNPANPPPSVTAVPSSLDATTFYM